MPAGDPDVDDAMVTDTCSEERLVLRTAEVLGVIPVAGVVTRRVVAVVVIDGVMVRLDEFAAVAAEVEAGVMVRVPLVVVMV